MAEDAAGAEPPAVQAPSAEQALDWTGARLDEIGGQSAGMVEGVYVDAAKATPEWLLVRLGRFGHYTLVPFAHAAAAGGRVWVPYERAALRDAPRIGAGTDLSRETELELRDHFGIGEDSRSAELRVREPGSTTARSAATE
jgi:hypothetical protein